MFKINHLRADADKLCDYLTSKIEEINDSIKDQKDRTFDKLSLDRDGSRITVLEHSSKTRRNGSGRTFELFDFDCEKLDLYSSFQCVQNVMHHDFVLVNLFELFEQGIIEDENVVFVVFGDVSEEPYSVEYFVKGIFTDLDQAVSQLDAEFDDIVATRLDEVNDFYIGGYME